MGWSVTDRAQEAYCLVHVFVALADNANQGIVPVPKTQGSGDDAERNLYWGATFGVRTFLKTSGDWKEIAAATNPSSAIAERAVFRSTKSNVILVADAYRGREIRKAIEDFFRSASGHNARIGG
jgi:hypothetical protein